MLSLVLPERCVHCGDASLHSTEKIDPQAILLARYLCAVCHRMVHTEEAPTEKQIRNRLRLTAPDLDFDYCGTAYYFHAESPLQSLIHAFKYQGMPRLALLAGLAARKRLTIKQTHDYIVPIPLHRTRLAERGYNQAEYLAGGFIGGRERLAKAIRRIRPTPSQTHLSHDERYDNVAGAFSLSRHAAQLRGKRVLIIDDVMTTGATLASATETLLQAQPASVSIATLAAAVLD